LRHQPAATAHDLGEHSRNLDAPGDELVDVLELRQRNGAAQLRHAVIQPIDT